MENKTIKATDLSPEIIMEINGNISILGKSRMEDASLYYQEAHDWLLNYIKNINNPLTVTLDLSYFNSSSAKQLLKFLMCIDERVDSRKVIWIYPKKNDILLERGRELEIMLDIPFVYQSK